MVDPNGSSQLVVAARPNGESLDEKSATCWAKVRRISSSVNIFFIRPLVHFGLVTVLADSAKNLPSADNGLVDMRAGAPVLAGTYAYDGPNMVTRWHSHDIHQLEYAFEGTIEVETDAAHYLLPPQQAAWIPAGLVHRSTLSQVRTVSVFFAPHMVPDDEGRARILAAAPVIREMILYGLRWPISRATSDAGQIRSSRRWRRSSSNGWNTRRRCAFPSPRTH
jgi:AraC-like ligand binding domain